jgi:pyruvate formate lyase activating enzyme
MNDPANTRPQDLLRAAKIGRESGLRFVYTGNLPGRVGDSENTRCPQCSTLLIERYGYLVEDYRLTADGSCPKCLARVPGRWATKFCTQITDTPFLPHRRSPFVTIHTQR